MNEAEEYIQNRNEDIRLKRSHNKFAFYFTAGLSAIIVAPTLFIMTLSFAACTIGIISYTFIGLFVDLPNIVNIGTTVYGGLPAFILAVITGAILFILAVLCWKLLKKYLSFVSNRYQKLREIKSNTIRSQ